MVLYARYHLYQKIKPIIRFKSINLLLRNTREIHYTCTVYENNQKTSLLKTFLQVVFKNEFLNLSSFVINFQS